MYLPSLDRSVDISNGSPLDKELSIPLLLALYDLANAHLLKRFCRAHRHLWLRPNANERLFSIALTLFPLLKCQRTTKGKGRPTHFHEFEFIFLYSLGHSTITIATLLQLIAMPNDDPKSIEVMAIQCIDRELQRNPLLDAAAAITATHLPTRVAEQRFQRALARLKELPRYQRQNRKR